MVSSWIALDIASLILPNFVWAENLIELYFPCHKAKNWLGFREIAFLRDSNMLMSDKGTLIGKANTGIEMLTAYNDRNIITVVAAVTAMTIGNSS